MYKTITVSNAEYKSIVERSEANKDFWNKFGVKFFETFEIDPFLKKWIDKTHSSFGKTLDFSCGAGRNLLYLLKKGVDVYGFDFSEVSVEHARSESGKINNDFSADEHIKVATMYDISNLYSPQEFRTVIAYAVLYENLYKGFLTALNEATTVLEDRGKFFAMMRTKPELDAEKVEEVEKGEGYATLFHKYNNTTRIYFQPDFFVALVESIGFSLIGSSPEFDFGSRKNSKAMNFLFEKDTSKKDLEIIINRE